jgi:hypothetical protein
LLKRLPYLEKEGTTVVLSSSLVVPSPPPVGPLGRLLLHPGTTQRRWLHQLGGWATSAERPALLVATGCVAAFVAWWGLREIAGRRVIRNGQWLSIIPAAQPVAGSGLALWRLLHPLLTSQPGLTGRRPPVAFEIIAEGGVLRLGLWISPTLSAHAVSQSIISAYPGAHVAVGTIPKVLPREATIGSQAVLRLPDWFPLGGHDQADADPMRGLLNTLADVASDETAVLQILGRPASGRRIRRARGAAAAARSGDNQPNMLSRRGPLRTASTQRRATADPVAAADVRDITAKVIAGPHFQVAIRIAVTGGPGRAGRRHRQVRLAQFRAALGLYTGRNQLYARRLTRPVAALSRRRLRRGFLLSATELAALAHLPAEPGRYGLPAGPAHQVAPPTEIAHG